MRRTFSAVAFAVAAFLLVAVSGCGSTKTVTQTVTAPAPQPPRGRPVSEPVAAGAHDFVQFACAKCHGDRGRGGVSPGRARTRRSGPPSHCLPAEDDHRQGAR